MHNPVSTAKERRLYVVFQGSELRKRIQLFRYFLVILGCTCIVAPGGVDVSRDVLWVDLPLGALVAIACYPVFRSDRKVSRREGTAFVLIYAIYMAVLLLRT